MELGMLFNTDRMAGPELVDYARRVDALGYESLWVPELFGREPFAAAAWLLAATERITVATGIVNVYARDAVATAAGATTLAELSGGRFHLGLGVSNARMNTLRGDSTWLPPARKIEEYVTAVRSAPLSIAPAAFPVTVAAHGPLSIAAAAGVADGVSTYLMTEGHTTRTRAVLDEVSPGTELTSMTMVLRCEDAEAARRLARKAAAVYIGLPHYLEAWRPDGYDERDLEGGGSDRLVDELVAWGSVAHIRERLAARAEAGADRIVVVPLNAAGGREPDWELVDQLPA
jgi:probable F420-dependent oxidoreductase